MLLTLPSQPTCRRRPTARLPSTGPRDTPFEGGVFYVNIELEDQYPFVPPKMRFITKVPAWRCSWLLRRRRAVGEAMSVGCRRRC